MRWGVVLALLAGFGGRAAAQAPGVAVYEQGRNETQYEARISETARGLFRTGQAVKVQAVREQLKRKTCRLELPRAHEVRLGSRELYAAARRSHLRVGWAYTCTRCEDWHLNLAGGYLITTNGAAATCYHVVRPDREARDGCLVAADEAGRVWPITEVLAADRPSDSCVVQVGGVGFKPLPLNTNVYPGDAAFCYSDPLDRRGFFSSGIVNRFFRLPGRSTVTARRGAAHAPTRIDLSTDWAPGSSGSAVLDEYGNAMGHVSSISVISEEDQVDAGGVAAPCPAVITFHEAVSARDVLSLIRPAR